MVITISKAVRKNGELTAVFAADIFLHSLIDIVNKKQKARVYTQYFWTQKTILRYTKIPSLFRTLMLTEMTS